MGQGSKVLFLSAGKGVREAYPTFCWVELSVVVNGPETEIQKASLTRD